MRRAGGLLFTSAGLLWICTEIRFYLIAATAGGVLWLVGVLSEGEEDQD